jgi:hypothetical protein
MNRSRRNLEECDVKRDRRDYERRDPAQQMRACLGDHLKAGHTLSLQNRPTRLA